MFTEPDPAAPESTEPEPTTPESTQAKILLTAAEARVLGALMEKEATTPENYPLSLNALLNACNQRSNREPVMELDEEAVRQALHRLEDHGLAGRARNAEGRVGKYEHWMGEAFNFSRAEAALICVLLLRGAQTPGELRNRTERIYAFDEIGDVLSGLQRLMDRMPPLTTMLPRQPGTKEARAMHLLCGEVAGAAILSVPTAASLPVSSSGSPTAERIAVLEATVADLRREVEVLHDRLDQMSGSAAPLPEAPDLRLP